MAWRLRNNANFLSVTIPDWTPTSQNSWRIRLKIMLDTVITQDRRVMGREDGWPSPAFATGVQLTNNLLRFIYHSANFNSTGWLETTLTAGVVYDFLWTCDGTNYQLVNNETGAVLVSKTLTSKLAEGTPLVDTIVGFFNGSFSAVGVNYYNVDLIDPVTPSNSRFYDANLSGGTGNIYPSTTGANNGIQQGLWPENNNEWVFYNSITSIPVPSNTLGAALNQPCAINLNNYFTGATSFSVLSGSLPAGLSISGNQIVGTPTTAQSTTLVIRASNSIDTLDSATITFNTGLWFLRFDGVDDRINIPVVTLGVNDYVEVVITNYTGKSGAYHFLMDDDSETSRLFFGIRTTNRIEIPAGTTALVNGVPVANDGLFTTVMNGADHTIRLTNNSGTKRVGRIGSRLNGIETWPGGIKSVVFSIGGSVTRFYDPNASGGVGNLLIDRVSNQNGTQSGTWPTNDSEWVSYAPPPQTSNPTQIKLFDGTAFSNRTIKRWNGSAFVDVTLKRWNGSAFVDL